VVQMQLDKAQIVEFLKQRGRPVEAQRAAERLPNTVDTDEQGGLLAQHGVSVEELLNKFGGGTGDLP
jgi:hypothetical protein